MNLSKLVFLAVKNVIYLDDEGFTYDSFLAGEYDNNIDYARSINNVFTPLNKAIHRLSDRHKIKHKVVPIGMTNNVGMLDITAYKNDVKKVVNVFTLSSSGTYYRANFREYGRDKIAVINFSKNTTYYMEYIQDIKYFEKDDFYVRQVTEEETISQDIDLKDYGITDTMCSYIIEFVQGHLLEPINPEEANMHRIYAEQCFDDLDNQQTSFSQTSVAKKYKI